MKAFVASALGLAVAVAAGCEKKSTCETEGARVEVSGNHGHEATVAGEHVARGVGGTHPLKKGSGTHEHAFILKDGDIQKLVAGMPVTTRATSVNAHTHEVTVRCK